MRFALALLALTGSAYAGTFSQVSNFGTNPTNLRMYEFVPTTIKSPRSLLVAVHFCTGSASQLYNGYEYDSEAEKHGFVVVYPETSRSGSCWDVSTSKSLTRNGGSDPVGIISMTNYAISKYSIDPNRVFVSGVSSGAMMTNVLLATYPDVFVAGAAFMGVPYTCFATESGGNPSGSQSAGWNNNCANGQVSKTAQEWGDIARNGYPGYTGRKPRVQLWHGSQDTTLNFKNLAEEVKMWTNYHGLSQTPTSQDNPGGWQRAKYGTVVESHTVNVGHSLPQNGQVAYMVTFMGLDGTVVATTTSPKTSPKTSPATSPATSPKTSPKTSPTTTPSPLPTNCIKIYNQCGGKSYTGVKCCVAGTTCSYISEWYSQCR